MNRMRKTTLAVALCLACCFGSSARGDEPLDFNAVLEVFEAVVEELAPAPPRVKGRAVLQINQQEAQIKQIMPHFVQQLRPVLVSELNFIRQMCDVPKEQRPRIKAAGEASLEKAARQLAEQQFGGNRRVLGLASESDPRKTIGDDLAQALKAALSSEQMAEYMHEVAKRTDRRKRAAVLTAVSLLDEAIWLTPQQRNEIHDSLVANWQPGWEQWLMLHRYGGQYFPMIPNEHVVPHLNEEQRRVWDGLQKISLSSWSGAEAQIQEDDGWWGDEPAKPAGAAEAPAFPIENAVIITR